ncbi:unnamed protein product, partial [Mesorhabditis belari]|uniref:Uncharacterized protein n=1 Tax=Mesorhabditis belari TaxID=2138241 RepID=A0AAF3EAW3_9BILA
MELRWSLGGTRGVGGMWLLFVLLPLFATITAAISGESKMMPLLELEEGDEPIYLAVKRAPAIPFQGGMYGKRAALPFQGGMYGKRATMPFGGGMYGKRAAPMVPFSGGMYGKRGDRMLRSMPFSGGIILASSGPSVAGKSPAGSTSSASSMMSASPTPSLPATPSRKLPKYTSIDLESELPQIFSTNLNPNLHDPDMTNFYGHPNLGRYPRSKGSSSRHSPPPLYQHSPAGVTPPGSPRFSFSVSRGPSRPRTIVL